MKRITHKLLLAVMLLTVSITSSCGKGDEIALLAPGKATGADLVPTEQSSGIDHTRIYDFDTTEIWCHRDTNRIYGKAYIPRIRKNKKLPLVILSHGFKGDHRKALGYAQFLAQHGYMTYCFDFCGSTPESLSDGLTVESSIRTQEADLKAIIDHLSAHKRVDADRIYLFGGSQGGLVSAMTAADYPDLVRATVLLYPGFNIRDMIVKRFPDRENIPERWKLWGVVLGRIYATDAYDLDVYTELPKFTKDVLIVHGTADSLVPITYSERMVELYHSAVLKRMEGEAHRLGGIHKINAYHWMLEFLNAEEKL